MKSAEVEKVIDKLEQAIESELNKKNYDIALSLISVCANVLYKTNIKYMDFNLEKALEIIAKDKSLNRLYDNKVDSETIIFWDGFGLNDRGLIQIYLKALCEIKRVIYVTYSDRKNELPDVDSILESYHAKSLYVDRNSNSTLAIIDQLNGYIVQEKPGSIFFYSTPDDVVALPLMYAYEGKIKRYLINLTDHAFWLGAGCCDKCINFRDYGARISKEYRGISEEKNVIIPFYPIIHFEKEFLGYPFELKSEQKVIFSGGALYKTLGESNKYYLIVEHILNENKNAVFWYAGSGDDTELRKLINKFPERVYHTKERSDLFQVLEHCDLYLSTYPMCGGLMFQYSAIAGKVPVTLKHSNISDDFLINQKNIDVEFENIDLVYKEINKLLSDNEYADERAKLMKKSVISPNMFNSEVRELLSEGIMTFKSDYEHIDTERFRQWYLDELSNKDINKMLVSRNGIKAGLKHFPIRFLNGCFHIVKERI